MNETFEMVAKTLYGLEEFLAGELLALGANDLQIGRRMVSFTEDSYYRQLALQNFLLQLAANFLWTILFFGCHAYGLSLLWLLLLWNLVLRMIRSFRQVDKTAGNLQVPYLLWVTLAAFLNLGVWFLNR